MRTLSPSFVNVLTAIERAETIDRHNTNSIKYDFIKEHQYPDDVLPLWVADMDFQSPPEVITAIFHCDKEEDYLLLFFYSFPLHE